MTKQDKMIAAYRTRCCNARVSQRGRATWVCGICKKDTSLDYIFFCGATEAYEIEQAAHKKHK